MEARLFTWAKAACATQKVELNNLGSAFTDGRVLCALIRAYAPMMIPKRRIGSAPLKLNDADPETAKSALMIARDNFSVASKALQALGGVPNPTFDIRLSASGDDVESPDPRAVSGYLLFLSARLLLLRQQEVACIRVQRWWRMAQAEQTSIRRRRSKVDFGDDCHRFACASRASGQVCSSALGRHRKGASLSDEVRSERVEFMKKRDAAVKIQAFYRMRIAHLQFEDAKWAVTKMQKIRKGSLQRKRFQEQRRAASLIQGWYRTVVARNEYLSKAIRCHGRSGALARIRRSQARKAD
jgi:abnormal spindle-like microcephaly-associated protein